MCGKGLMSIMCSMFHVFNVSCVQCSVQFKPQYNTYTMYNDMDAEDAAAHPEANTSAGANAEQSPRNTPRNPYHSDHIDAGRH